jgi:hypothetical protein
MPLFENLAEFIGGALGPSHYSRPGSLSDSRDPIPYALETDWPVGAGGFEPVHQNQSR